MLTFDDKPLFLLDCGAVVDCKPDNLLKFAKVGVAASKAYNGIESPKVGLINAYLARATYYANTTKEIAKATTDVKSEISIIRNLVL